jgi:endo-1,3-1,4-beta-glycanase ExoK
MAEETARGLRFASFSEPLRTRRTLLFCGFVTAALLSGIALTLALSGQFSRPPPAAALNLTAESEASPSFVTWFGGSHDESRWFKSDFYYPNSAHPAWKAENIHFRSNRIEMEVRRERVAYKNYTGGEYHRRGRFHYGRYEVVMRAAPGSGTVSAMFTHTGEYFGDPHDEIDIEFVGKQPRKLHINYFTDGRAHGSVYIPLRFDASREIALYAFEWDPDEIRWFVDDELVFVARDENHPLPQTPGRLMMHAWSGTPAQYGWHGYPTFRNGTRAAFYCLSFQQSGDSTEQCSDRFDRSAANRNANWRPRGG